MANSECNRGITDTGKSTAAYILEAAAIAVAGINTAAAIRMANLQYEIAKQYLDIAQWWRNYYNTTYRPVEDTELQEAWALQKTDPLYDVAVGRARSYIRIALRGRGDKAIRCTSEYCTGLRGAFLKDAANEEATALAAASNLGYRNERAYVVARDNVRWERRAQVLQRGRNMVANNVQYSNLAAGIFGDLGRQAGMAAGGAVRYLAYETNRNDTLYPDTFIGQAQLPPVPVATPTPMMTASQEVSGYRWDAEANTMVPAI